MSNQRVTTIIAGVIAAEGGYSNNKNDRGGETMYGITVSVARLNGYTGPMRLMPRAFAEAVYLKRYVSEPKFDRVLVLSERLGEELIDTGVNMGPATAAIFLQRWLNGFNTKGSGYDDLFVDGRLGPITLDALRRYLTHRGKTGEDVLYTALNCTQGSRYLDLTEANNSQRTFLYGWMRGRVML